MKSVPRQEWASTLKFDYAFIEWPGTLAGLTCPKVCDVSAVRLRVGRTSYEDDLLIIN